MANIELTLDNFNEQDRKTLVNILRHLRKLADITDGLYVRTYEVNQRGISMHWAWEKPIDVAEDGNHVVTVLEQSAFRLAHILNKLLDVQPEDELPETTDGD